MIDSDAGDPLTGSRDPHARLAGLAPGYARVALENVRKEFPADVWHTMAHPGDFPERPRDRNPAFYGSFDWHSCLEMHWLLVRLLRLHPDRVPVAEIRGVLGEHLTAENLAGEARFLTDPDNAGRQRPYGWGWALALGEELRRLATDPTATTETQTAAADWAAASVPLTAVLRGHLLQWLAREPYPVRYGIHANSAFGLSRVLPFARREADAGDATLLTAVSAAARTWFGDDRDYPLRYEPSGHDFLSPALTEAELVGEVLDPAEFASWLTGFLPGLGTDGELLTPAVVSDASDGQTAHLRGLNLSRAASAVRVAGLLPESDRRRARLSELAWVHAEATLPYVIGDGYLVEHWLAAYAVLFLTGATARA